MAGLANISASDCKMLELMIIKKTNRRISETTLKRIYGFALSNYNPSLFTINTLARYCDYESWDDFCKQREEQEIIKPDKNVNWSLLKVNANKITSFTLQALKNKAGIPYRQTIKRNFIDDHFEAFLNEGNTATVISAPAGYGKTLALCHWIDEQQAQNENNIFLFFSSSALMNVFLSGRNMNDWLLALLGYSQEKDITSLIDIKQRKGGLFYLIVDGMDEHMFKNDQFQLVLDQVIDIFSLYQSHGWFKLILTMRSSTLINNRYQMEVGQDTWFSGFETSHELAINVPLFTIRELDELSHNINPSLKNHVSINAAEVLNHPLYFQLYYKLNKKDFSLAKITRLSIYELTLNFILNKIYQGNQSAEKMLIIKAIVENMDFSASKYEVSKLKIVNIIKQYNHAYTELISIGFIKEVNISNEADYHSVVAFGNRYFLEFSISKILLLNNDNLFDSTLIDNLNSLFKDNDKMMPVLKWSIIHAFKTDQHSGLNILAQARLTIVEKSEVVIFVGALLEKEGNSEYQSAAWYKYFEEDCDAGLFNYLFGLEFIDNDYIQTLHTLFLFNLSTTKSILVYCGLATIALLRLEMDSLEKYLAVLNGFSGDDYAVFPINPLKCLNAVYNYFKYGIIKNDAFLELTRFYINPNNEASGLIDCAANDLIYLYGAYTLKICNNPAKTIRYINVLNKHYKAISDFPTVYNVFLKRILIEEHFANGKVDEGMLIYHTLNESYHAHKNAFTPFMKSTFNGIKIIVNLYTNQHNCMVNAVHNLNLVYDGFGYKLSKLYVLTFLLKYQTVLDHSDSIYKQLKYDYTRIIRESSLSPRTFEKQSAL